MPHLEHDFVGRVFASLDEFQEAHRTAQEAYTRHANISQLVKNHRLQIAEQVAAETNGDRKPKFSNQEKRDLEVERRLAEQHGDWIAEEIAASREKYETACSVERYEREVKVYTAALMYETSRNDLEVARLNAETAATYGAELPVMPSYEPLPAKFQVRPLGTDELPF